MGNPEPKFDYLKECMTDPALVDRTVPIDQFCQAYCVVCAYKPCVRSRANQMVFTERVANWRPRMFTEVPRASENDENYANIRAKNFQSVGDTPVVNTSASSLVTTNPAPVQPPEKPVHFTPIESTDTPPAPPVPTSVPATPPLTQPVTAPRQAEPTLNNTPFQGGIVLPGKPVDKGQDQKIDIGGTFTFGDDESK